MNGFIGVVYFVSFVLLLPYFMMWTTVDYFIKTLKRKRLLVHVGWYSSGEVIHLQATIDRLLRQMTIVGIACYVFCAMRIMHAMLHGNINDGVLFTSLCICIVVAHGKVAERYIRTIQPDNR